MKKVEMARETKLKNDMTSYEDASGFTIPWSFHPPRPAKAKACTVN